MRSAKTTVTAVLSVVLLLCPACADSEESRGNGLLEGKVTIGPMCPVEPCKVSADSLARQYRERRVLVYVEATKAQVAEGRLNDNGEYSIVLRPGKYIVDVTDAKGRALALDPHLRPVIGTAQPRIVRVKAGAAVTVNFDIDTGMR